MLATFGSETSSGLHELRRACELPSGGSVRYRVADGVLHVAYSCGAAGESDVGVALDLHNVDASGYDRLSLRVRGDAAAGFAPRLEVGVRRPSPSAPDLIEEGSRVLDGITPEWQQFQVPLNQLAGIGDWSRLDQFFVSVRPEITSVAHGAYDIDDVALVAGGARQARIDDPVSAPKKKAWEESLGGRAQALPVVARRLRGWPQRVLIDRQTLPKDQAQFLRRLARDTWRGIDALTDRENALPLDHVRFASAASTDPAQAKIGDYTNVTNIGVYLMAVVAAHDLAFLTRDEAIERLGRTLDTLGRLETHEGFFFNYYDTVTLERTSNFLSFVDSSWLSAGLIVVRSAFAELAPRCAAILDRQSYRFFYDPRWQQMSHGYYVNVPVRSPYHYGVFYTEARIGALIAIGKGDVPEDLWFGMSRIFPPSCDWQKGKPLGMREENVLGHDVREGYYEWQGLRFVPSWGGSMFEALMPALVLDEPDLAPASLGANDAVHALVQRRYALEVLKYPVWGLSPSEVPGSEAYREYGAEVLGVRGYGGGAVAPYASALALRVEPKEAAENLFELAQRYDMYGEYGLYDAVDPLGGAVAYGYLALDQSMTLVALANQLKDGAISKRFAADPIVARVLPLLAAERFFE